MLSMGRAKVFVYVPPCDMRKQMFGLSNVVRNDLERDPQDGDLYLFRNRRRDMIEILFYDRGGFCLLAKRLDKGTFVIDLAVDENTTHVEVSAKQIASLLSEARIVQKSAQSR